jgi:hypothetical protein
LIFEKLVVEGWRATPGDKAIWPVGLIGTYQPQATPARLPAAQVGLWLEPTFTFLARPEGRVAY